MPRLLPPACALSLAVAASCGGSTPAPAPARAPIAPPSAAILDVPLVHPARYLVPEASWIERTSDGLDRVVVSGRRVELRGVETVHLAPAEPEIAGGAIAPSWAPPGPARYVFWKGRELYGAETFTGELHRIGSLPAEPDRAVDWLGGTGLLLHGGAVFVPSSGKAILPLPVAAVADAVAADEKRALVIDALGRSRLTVDGGATFSDVTIELGPAIRLDVRGDEIAVTLHDGSERFVGPSGAIALTRSGHGPAPGKPSPEVIDAWPRGAERGALDAAVKNGLPLPDGGALITSRGLAGRLDLATGRTTSLVPLPEAADAECSPIRAGSSVLLACADKQRALVIDVGGAPRVERTFDLAGAPELDRFAGADGEALGYLGPCDGSPPRAPVADTLPGEPYNHATGRSAVFCVRASADDWVEHRLGASDAADVIAWIPRRGGGAVALVARQGTFLPDAERVTVRGGLRIVRVARNEPPLGLPTYRHGSPGVLSRSLRASADDVIEGWIPGGSGSLSAVAVTIDAAGKPRAHPPPARATQLSFAGRFALVRGEEGPLFESTDWGHHWTSIEPPPGASNAYVSHCSAVGCRIGTFVRVGWSAGDSEAPEDPSSASSKRAAASRPPPPPPPILSLACSFDGPPEGKRASDSYGFGYTPVPQQRGAMPVRMGTQGVAMFPWNGPQGSLTGDVELGFIPPLDLSAPLRRETLSLSRAGIGPSTQRSYEIKLGYLLAPSGELDLFPIAHREACLGSLLDMAGLTRPIGGCIDDQAVGVDLGGRVMVMKPSWDGIVTLGADAPPRRKSESEEAKGKGKAPKSKEPPIPRVASALHELARNPAAAQGRGFLLGAGLRDGAPVAVIVDVAGEALLSPVDPEKGTLGGEERLAPLTAAALGSEAACGGGVRAGEASVVLGFDHAIGVDRARLRGLVTSSAGGVAVLRWGKERVCLDAVEVGIRDERFEMDLGPYEGAAAVRKLIGRFAGKAAAAEVLITSGAELRQKIICSGVARAAGEP